MRIAVDRDLCQGHGVCCEEAPGVFALDENGELRVLEPEPGPSRREEVERAVRYCPTRALRLQD